MQPNRTPKQHRDAVAAWRETAPANDVDIFRGQWDADQRGLEPRHSKMAEQLAPLLKWMNRPEGLLPDEDKPEEIAPIKTNWNVVPDNDNPRPEGHKSERSREITPSVEMIEREMASATYRDAPARAVLKGGKAYDRGHRVEYVQSPDGGDIKRNRYGQLERIGNISFACGHEGEYDTPSETAYKLGPDGAVVMTKVRTPTGGIVGQSERPSRIEGAEDNPAEVKASNDYFAEMLGTGRHRYIPGSTKKRKGKSYNATESRAMLAEAVANTKKMPKVRKCPTALPCGSARVADSFLGMKKAAKGDSGSQGWEDICTALVNREIWAEAIQAMKDKDISVLQEVTEGKAQSFEAMGLARGHDSKYAVEVGKKVVRAANDNLKINLKKMAA